VALLTKVSALGGACANSEIEPISNSATQLTLRIDRQCCDLYVMNPPHALTLDAAHSVILK